jgi:hypothetical protein
MARYPGRAGTELADNLTPVVMEATAVAHECAAVRDRNDAADGLTRF